MGKRLIALPFVVFRMAGLPAKAATFSSGEIVAALRAEQRLEQAIANLSGPVCDKLATWLPTVYDHSQKLGRALLQVKRDLFNTRCPSATAVAALSTKLPADLDKTIHELIALISNLNDINASREAIYARETAAAHLKIQAQFGHQNLQRAIEISNPSLYDKLVNLQRHKTRVSNRDQKLLSTNLARYVLRSARKTSPLSSFGLVALGRWTDTAWPPPDDDPLVQLPADTEWTTRARIAAVEYIVYQLLARYHDIDPRCEVMLNKSLMLDGATYTWLRIEIDDSPESPTRGTRVARVRSRAQFITLLQRLFNSTDAAALPLMQIHSTLLELLGPGSAARVDELLLTAWRQNLLQPDLPADDDTATWSRSALACLVTARREAVLPALEEFFDAVHAPRATPGYVHAAEQAFSNLLGAGGIIAPSTSFRPILFEDCTLPPLSCELSRGLLNSVQPELTALLQAMPILNCDSPLAIFRRRISNFFRARYGEDGICTDVYAFVSAFAQHLEKLSTAKSQNTASGEITSSTEESPKVDEGLLKLRAELLQHFAARAHSSLPVSFSVAELEPFLACLPDSAVKRSCSQMFFLQPVPDGKNYLLALNQIYPGACATISRFLPDHPDVTGPIREYLTSIADTGGYLELPGSFGFNVNIHPQIAAQAVSIPPFATPSEQQTVNLDSLRLQHSSERDELAFIDQDGQAVDILYLSLMTPLLLPKMQQVITALAFNTDRLDGFSSQLLAHLAADFDGEIELPRMQLGKLIIVRRLLGARHSLLPSARLSNCSFFIDFNAWADTRNLPRYLFFQRLTIAARWSPDSSDDRTHTWPSVRLAKPMPLDRECPVAVQILQRSLAASELDVLFTEALPDGQQTGLYRAGEMVVGELGFELTLKNCA